MRSSILAIALLIAPFAAQQAEPARPALGESVTTTSGLIYKFTQLGKGPKPADGDLMVIHGIGTLTDGKEFWNTRTDGAPYEYTLGVDSVIRGFAEGMRVVREGDRIVITMKPELGDGATMGDDPGGSGVKSPPPLPLKITTRPLASNQVRSRIPSPSKSATGRPGGSSGPDPEPLPDPHPLRGRDNVIITPHVAWYSEQALVGLQAGAPSEVRRVLTGQFPVNVVNRAVKGKNRAGL